jgi:hypothetical protein
MSRYSKGSTPLLVIFAAVLVIGMLFFSKQNIVSGFAPSSQEGFKEERTLFKKLRQDYKPLRQEAFKAASLPGRHSLPGRRASRPTAKFIRELDDIYG